MTKTRFEPMPNRQLNVVVQHLCAAAERDGGRSTDGELLTRFLSSRDDDALAALVVRHAPMVWGVCRPLLTSPHDAEDAFQATFLVLVRKAAAVVPRELVGNWLYGVARQTALRLRATQAKRGGREVQMKEMPEPAVAEAREDELRACLDQELSRLPQRFRALIVLCDLEGMSRKDAAGQLGCPEGTVASGLARARGLLAKRLALRGLALSGGSLTAALSHSAASAGAPSTVVTSAIDLAIQLAAGEAVGAISGPAADLAEGVVKAMLMTKLKAVVAVVMVLGVMSVGAVALGYHKAAAQGDKPSLPVTDDKTQVKGDNLPAVPAAADPAPAIKFRVELGGGDTKWAQIGVYAPDGKTLYAVAGGGNPGLVYVIDPVAGQKLATLKLDPPADATRGSTTGATISPDGKYLAVAYGAGNKDPNAAVKETGWELVLWDLAARKVVGTTRGDGERWQLTNLTFSPDSKLLAGNAAGYDKTINWYKSVALVWDVPGLAKKHAFETRAFRYAAFSSMSFAREGDADILRAFDWGAIHRWDLATGKALEIVRCDYGNRFPTGSSFSPDGKTVAVLSEVRNESTGARLGAELSLFDTQTGGKPRSIARGHKAEASGGGVYSRDGKRLASTSYRAVETVVWDAEKLTVLATMPTYGQLAWSPDDETLAVSGSGFWSPAGRHLFTMGRHGSQVWAVAASPKGRGFASCQNMPVVHFWDAATLKNTLNVPFDQGGRRLTRSLAYSTDGGTLATTYGDKVKFIDSSSGRVRSTAERHTSGVNAVAFSPDGKHFASASGGVTGVKWGEPKRDPGEVIIWTFDGEKATPVHTIKAAHPAGAFSLAFSPDGKSLATGGGSPSGLELVGELAPAGEAATKEAVRLWDVATGKKTAAFPCGPAHHVNALAWSPDGKTIAHTGIGGTRVRLLDLATGKERALLQAPTQALAFSPDGLLLAAVGYGGRANGQGLVELWNPATGEKLASEVRHEQGVNCVAFGPDGKVFVTGGSDGVLNLWDVNLPKK